MEIGSRIKFQNVFMTILYLGDAFISVSIYMYIATKHDIYLNKNFGL